jgi:hypothetical protein
MLGDQKRESILSAPAERSGDGAFHSALTKSKAASRYACRRTPNKKPEPLFPN